MNPDQATAYLLGKNEIQRLRQLTQAELGAHFDMRQFHNEVLKSGMISLSILRAQIDFWINTKK